MDTRTEQIIKRGREAFDRRDYSSALADFREVLESHPDFADIRHLTGVCLSFLGNAEEALVEFERALALNDRYVEAHLNYAITLNELGRYEEAQTAFERAGQYEAESAGRFPAVLSARLANTHAALGDLYLHAGAHADAAAQYRAAIELRPSFHDIRAKLAHALLELDDLDGAEAELARALEGNARFLQARLTLGLIHFRRGDTVHAAEEWERCRAQDPSHPQIRSYLSMLERQRVAHDPAESDG